MGLGLLGRGVGDAKFIADCGAEVLVTDLKTKKELASSLQELKGYKNIKYVLGQHRLADFTDCDLVIRSADVKLDSPYLNMARQNNIPIKMDASLFLALAPKVISIGITGTKGKSTVTALIFQIIENYLKGNKKVKAKVYLGGNVRGLATLPLLKKVKAGDIVVLELDSWQLQGFGEAGLSPHIAVFTNLMADHLNYYGGSMKKYFLDKKNIYRFQTAKDYLVLGKSVLPLVKKSGAVSGKIVTITSVPDDWPVKLPGKHNLINMSLAQAVAKILKIPETIVQTTLANFAGLSGRLEFVREFKGVKYYNDTTATMPEAVMAGLEAFVKYRGHIILIGGGNDKSLDYKKYGESIPSYVKKLILLPGLGTDKIKKSLTPNFKSNILLADSMAAAVNKAKAIAVAGDIVLLSPGASSFGPPPGGFKNEFDRGDQFTDLVKKLKG